MKVIKEKTIRILLNERSFYDCEIKGTGDGFKELGWWLKHLVEKSWWSKNDELTFTKLCLKIYGKK